MPGRRRQAASSKADGFRIIDTSIDPCDEQIAIGSKFDDRKARRVLYFVECAGRSEAALAVIHCKANVGARLVAFFSRNRPNHISAIIRAASDFRSVLFALNRFLAAVY